MFERYFIRQKIKDMRTNKHHRIPKSRNWSNDPDNIKNRDVWKHIDRHVVFWNDTPVEQLIKVFQVNRDCRSKEFKRALIDLFVSYQGEYYKENCCKEQVIDDLSKIK